MKRRPGNALSAVDITATQEASFWSLVRIDWQSGCWLWQGGTEGSYGRFKLCGGRRYQAHRVSYALAFGFCPERDVVRHKCDNGQCVAPHHLELGTEADNARDRVERNRQARGERAGTATLTEAQVLEIRADKRASRFIGEEYGVHGSTVLKIRNRQNWTHL